MSAFTTSLFALIAIGYVSSLVLENYQRTVDASNVGQDARPDPEPKLRGGKPAPKS